MAERQSASAGIRKKSMEVLVPILLIAIGGYAALAGVVYLIQGTLLFVPGELRYGDPSSIGLAYEEARLSTEDGESLQAWWVPRPDARATVLFFHGNAGNITTRLETIRTLHRLGLNTFIIDYRGYGESSGRPTEKGLYRDAETAWRYLISERGLPPGEIVLYGRSLGAAVAIWLAERVPEGALIAESGFTSVPEIGAHHYPYLPVRMLSRMQFDSLARIGNCRSPALIIHSRDDEIIPFSHGERLFDAAAEPKRFVELAGSHENSFVLSHETYSEAISDFVDAYVAVDRSAEGSQPAQERN